jgi:cysteine synthase A
MSRWYEDNSLSIGRTPLIRLNRIVEGTPATLFAKIEGATRPIPSSAGSAPQ